MLPRGSVRRCRRPLRFFVYWKERQQRTDYDLSVLLLDDEFTRRAGVLDEPTDDGVVHSGDITEAPNGATEFIDVPRAVSARYVVPQVNVYCGRVVRRGRRVVLRVHGARAGAAGRPVRAADRAGEVRLFGTGRVSLPMVFARGDDGGGTRSGCTSGLGGHPQFNRVEGNARSTSLLVRAIAERRYLRRRASGGAAARGRHHVQDWPAELDPAEPVTYLGLDRPDGLPADSAVFTPANLPELLNSA